MIRIKYREYFFYEPRKLTQNEFLLIKQTLSPNKNAKVFPEPPTWMQLYKTHFLIILIGIFLTCIGLTFFTNKIITTVFSIIGIITMFFSFVTVVIFVKETTSYRVYYKGAHKYYSTLKKIVLSSKNYDEFEAYFLKERMF